MKINTFLLMVCLLVPAAFSLAQNNALDFDGNNDYVSIDGLDMANATLTVEAWVKARTFNTGPLGANISNLVVGGDENVVLRIGDDGYDDNQPQFAILPVGDAHVRLGANARLEANKWYHIAGVYDGVEMKLYINGVLDNSLSETRLVQSTSNPALLCGNPSGRYLDGFIDEVRVWNDARTEAEIRQNMYRELPDPGSETNLVAYYKLNETTGLTASDSKGSYNGVLNNMSSTDWVTSPAIFGPKNCLDFDGTDDYVDLGNSSDLRPTTALTFECWMNPESWSISGTHQVFAGNTQSGGYNIAIGYPTSTDIGFAVYSNGNYRRTDADVSGYSGWHHVAGTFDGQYVSLYVDGILKGQLDMGSAGNLISYSVSNSTLLAAEASSGSTPDEGFYYDGKLDEIRFWNVARTEAEIQEGMCRVLSGNESGLVGYYTADRNTDDALPDFSGDENDGTLKNMDNNDWESSTAFNTWLNTSSTSWTTATNWSLGSVPTATGNTGIYSYSGEDPAISGSFSAYTAYSRLMYIASGATFNVLQRATLDVSDILVNDGTIDLTGSTGMFAYLVVDGVLDNNGTIDIEAYGDASIDGNLDGTGGTINLLAPGAGNNYSYLRLGGSVTAYGTLTYYDQGQGGYVIFDKEGDQNLPAGDFPYLSLTGSGTKTIDGNMTAYSFSSIDADVTANLGSNTLTVDGSGCQIMNGTFNANAGSIYCNGLVNLDAGFNAGTSTFYYNKNGYQGVAADNVQYYNLVLGTCPGSYKEVFYDLVVNNDLTLEASSELRLYDYYGGIHTLTVHGAVMNDGVVKLYNGGSFINYGTLSCNGSFEIPRTIQDDEWHFVSPPINNATANIFLADYLQYYTEATDTWTDIVNPATPLTPVKGYSLWGIEKATTHIFTGTPNCGDLSIGITSSGTGINKGFNLLGNPYPSSIDWAGLDDTYGAIYYWTGGGYISWNDGVGGGAQYVPPVQGFFIYTAAGGTFSVSNSDRTHTGSGTFYKSQDGDKISDGLVLTATGEFNKDELYIIFREDAKECFELTSDAWKLMTWSEGTSQIFSYCPEGKLSIDARPAAEAIDIGFVNGKDGVYSIEMKEIDGIPDAILEDKTNGNKHNLMNGAYEFLHSATDPEDRFILHLTPMGVEELRDESFSTYASGGILYVFNSDGRNGTINVLDISGKVVSAYHLNGFEQQQIPLNLNTGIYIINIITEENTYSDKLFIK